MKKQKTFSLILRLGLAFAFIYAAISAFINPNAWVGFLPGLLRSEMILNFFGIGEIILGVWLLSGWRIFFSAILSALIMAGIILFNFGAMDIVFRDFSILLMAVALAFLNKK